MDIINILENKEFIFLILYVFLFSYVIKDHKESKKEFTEQLQKGYKREVELTNIIKELNNGIKSKLDYIMYNLDMEDKKNEQK